MSDETPKDWRGTPIEVGALVIYGAPVGRSIAMVEATVDGFTKSGRVWLRVIRRAHGYAWTDSKEIVHVGPDRLTIVSALPHSDAPTEADKIEKARRQQDEYQRKLATHDFQEVEPGRFARKCSRCGADNAWNECPG